MRLRRVMQLSLATLLLILLGFGFSAWSEHRRLQEFAAEVESSPWGSVHRAYRGPEWLGEWIERQHLEGAFEWLKTDVFGIEVTDEAVDDAWLEKRLRPYQGLKSVMLFRTSTTDAGLATLKSLPHLESVSLQHVPITDVGLEHLAEIPSLQWLDLDDTHVTPEGVKRFQARRPAVRVIQQP